MRIPLVVPDIRPGHAPLSVSGWFVDEGDIVLAGDLVVELLIPGITFDVTSNASGRLVEIVKPVDSGTAAGEILGWIEADLPDTAEPTEDRETA